MQYEYWELSIVAKLIEVSSVLILAPAIFSSVGPANPFLYKFHVSALAPAFPYTTQPVTTAPCGRVTLTPNVIPFASAFIVPEAESLTSWSVSGFSPYKSEPAKVNKKFYLLRIKKGLSLLKKLALFPLQQMLPVHYL